MSKIGCGADYGDAGASDAMQFWASWAAASSSSFMNMFVRGANWFPSVLMGGAPNSTRGSGGAPPLSGFFDDWFRLASFPFEWLSRIRGNDIPVMGIVLDTDVSYKGTYKVMTPYCVPDASIHVTPLHLLGDSKTTLPANKVVATLRPDGNVLTVEFIDLQLKDSTKGYYVGMVWAEDGSELRPLAILNVYVT